jgi:hypothetical protein
MTKTKEKELKKRFAVSVGRALRRSAQVARKTAKLHGTPLYFWKNGKIVVQKP